jgi:hypothetical protein
MARPSTYDPNKEYLKLAEEYLNTCGRDQTKLPKVSEFCREYIHANEETVNRWLDGEQIPEGSEIEELRDSIKKVTEAQKEQLMDDGLYGGKEVNNAMAIFLLKANHGMMESDRHVFEGEGFAITLDTKHENSKLSGSGEVPTETA